MIADRYTIGPELQRGAFGVIYKGMYEKKGEPVAIKMESAKISTLQHEVKMIQYLFMSGVRNIPCIYWFGTYLENPCVVITLFECSLYEYKISGKEITTDKMNKIMWKLLDIFEHVHKYFVVHRDIKPHNFMIKNGELYLIDFGLATFYINENGQHYPDTGGTTMIGSPQFASIRIHQGHRYSRRDDLISLGYLWRYMMGKCWSSSAKSNLSLLDLQHPMNLELQCQKENIAEENHYMKYVYSLEYEETPKYEPLKLMFL